MLLALLPVIALLGTIISDATAIPSVLVFSKISAGAYTHASIPFALDVITRLGSGSLALNDSVADPGFASSNAKWNVVQDDDDSKWTNGNYLNQFDAVVFLMSK